MYKAMVLDTETTGFNQPQVIEIAYQMLDGELIESKDGLFCQRFNPSKDIEEGALKVHGITKESLIGLPQSNALLEHAPNILSVEYIIGHYIKYDINAINQSVETQQVFKTICTKRLAYEVLKGEKSYSLVNLCRSLNLVDDSIIEHAHSADADVFMTTKLLQHIAKTLENQSGEKYNLDDLFELCQTLEDKAHAAYV